MSRSRKAVFSRLLLLLGDIFGYLALAFVVFTAAFMLVRRRLLRYTKNLNLLRQVHIYAATISGLFIILHVAYFYTYPITQAVALGYASAALAVFVWITGTAFLERFRDSLYFHGSLSLPAVGLMVIHAAGAGSNIPVEVALTVLVGVAVISLYKAKGHVSGMGVTPGGKKH